MSPERQATPHTSPTAQCNHQLHEPQAGAPCQLTGNAALTPALGENKASVPKGTCSLPLVAGSASHPAEVYRPKVSEMAAGEAACVRRQEARPAPWASWSSMSRGLGAVEPEACTKARGRTHRDVGAPGLEAKLLLLVVGAASPRRFSFLFLTGVMTAVTPQGCFTGLM